jgi:hypothetical protein
MRSFLCLIVLLCLVSSCNDGPTGPRTPSATGTWVGTRPATGFTLVVTFMLSEGEAGAITGTGLATGPRTSNLTILGGDHTHPTIVFTFDFGPGFDPATFTGTFTDDDTIAGELDGSGFVDFALTLMRQ